MDNFFCTEPDISDLGAELSRKVKKFQKTEEKITLLTFPRAIKFLSKFFIQTANAEELSISCHIY